VHLTSHGGLWGSEYSKSEKASSTEIWSDEAILVINVGFDRFFPGVGAIFVDKKFSGILGKRENVLGVKNGTGRVAGWEFGKVIFPPSNVGSAYETVAMRNLHGWYKTE